MKIQQGFVFQEYYRKHLPPVRDDRQEVIFPVPYKERPFVVLSLDRVDEGQFIEESQFKSQDNKPLLHTVNRLEIAAVSVSATGFVLEIKTWYNNLIYGYKVSWTAFGVE